MSCPILMVAGATESSIFGFPRRFRGPHHVPRPDRYHLPDLVGRRFTPGAPDVAWVQDITYIATAEGWLYVASVLDLGSRRLVGYLVADHMRTELVTNAPAMAIATRGGAKRVAGVICHADRGSQGTTRPSGAGSDEHTHCQGHTMRPSVGRTGVCWDNAVAESFWESLKRECVQGRVFATRAEARRAIFKWINWYNTSRLHSSLDHVAPLEWEADYRKAS